MKRLAFLISLIAALSGGAAAQDAQIRTKLDVTGGTWVGQKATLVVELLVPGFFAGSAGFDLPQVSGVLIIPPTESPVVGTELIGGISYTVQRHELAVFAQRAGAHEIPAFSVRFGFKRAPLDKEALPQKMMTTPVQWTAQQPPGAEKLGGIISARNLDAREAWQPQPGNAKAGDAFQRTITFIAPDVPGMAFPLFPAPETDGLGIYRQEPIVMDKSDRGVMRGQRQDRITYVCQRPGHFVVPAARLTWWDLDAQALRTIDFPARIFDVVPNPALASAPTADATGNASRSSWPWAMIAVAILAAFGLFFWRAPLLRATRHVAAYFRPVHLQPLNPIPVDSRAHAS